MVANILKYCSIFNKTTKRLRVFDPCVSTFNFLADSIKKSIIAIWRKKLIVLLQWRFDYTITFGVCGKDMNKKLVNC